MIWILQTPLELRLAVLFVFGLVVAGFLNLAIYRLAWQPRLLSPWSNPAGREPRSTWMDCIPIFGWLRLRRESLIHGRGFWIRPLAVELLTGLLFAGLYWWEVQEGTLLPTPLMAPVPPGALVTSNLFLLLHVQYLSHILLVSLMIVASLIDLDETIIPDTITVPGTLIGLTIATIYPWALLAANVWLPPGKNLPYVEFLTPTSPSDWPAAFNGRPEITSLLVGLGCWGIWCFGLLPRRWNTRRGWRKAWQYFWARVIREQATYQILSLAVCGILAIACVWAFGSRTSWAGLLTSLVGLAATGGLIWAVRIVGKLALHKEAMGFGDVTLMAMIGTFVGWQTGLVIFFFAPFAAIVIGGIQWLIHRNQQIPYGPFLCLGTLGVMLRWGPLWDRIREMFFVSWLMPIVMAVCLVLMGLLLGIWGMAKRALFRAE